MPDSAPPQETADQMFTSFAELFGKKHPCGKTWRRIAARSKAAAAAAAPPLPP